MSALIEAGLLTSAEAATASVRDLSRAHPVWGVSLADGRRLVVKAPAPERGHDLGIECLVYRMAVWCEPVAAALPTPVLVDEDLHLLVLEDAASASLAVRAGLPPQLGGAPVVVDPGWLTDAVASLGRTLGALHRGTAGLPLPPARQPVAIMGFAGGGLPAGRAGTACAEYAADPIISAAARSLAAPVAGCLVSHDMKWDNVIPCPGGRTLLLDWELAGLGDPAVDLGFLLSEHLVRDTLSDAALAPAPPAAPALSPAALSPAAQALLAGYAEAARPRPQTAAVFARRTVTAAGLRIAQLAVEIADTHPDQACRSLGDLARRTLLATDDLTPEVLSCLH